MPVVKLKPPAKRPGFSRSYAKVRGLPNGVEEAIVVRFLSHHVNRAAEKNRNLREGVHWYFNSLRDVTTPAEGWKMASGTSGFMVEILPPRARGRVGRVFLGSGGKWGNVQICIVSFQTRKKASEVSGPAACTASPGNVARRSP